MQCLTKSAVVECKSNSCWHTRACLVLLGTMIILSWCNISSISVFRESFGTGWSFWALTRGRLVCQVARTSTHSFIFPVQDYAEITQKSMWHSEMPVARWTITVNKATENFTTNYFKSLNASQVFYYIMGPFQNLWELTLHSIAFCWKIHKYYCQIKYLQHVSAQKLALTSLRLSISRSSRGRQL